MAMMTVCPNCGGLHPLEDGSCRQPRVKEDTAAVRFRNQRRWKKKSVAIRERDHYLCQICIIELFKTFNQYNYTSLEVNHIVPLEEDESLGLEDTNLLTMCTTHHKMADRGEIPRSLMLELAAENRSYEAIKEKARNGGYPPTPGEMS